VLVTDLLLKEIFLTSGNQPSALVSPRDDIIDSVLEDVVGVGDCIRCAVTIGAAVSLKDVFKSPSA